MKKTLVIFVLLIVTTCVLFRLLCGIIVIQPIGVIPEGTTIIYWRSGLSLPFIASADGLLEESGAGVSLLGRGLMIGKLFDTIEGREILRIKYSEKLYLLSTKGFEYEN